MSGPLSAALGRLAAPLRWLRGEELPRRVHEPREFRALLRRECARADRTGQEFSLLVFGAARETPVLLRVLAERVRETDELGRVDGGRVAVLLADTPASGAHALAAEVLGRVARTAPAPLYAVHTYPRDWVAGGGVPDGTGDGAPAEPPYASDMPAWKRAMDVAGALLALVALAPVLLLLALAVRLTSPGPVLFRQERIGYRGRPFTMYKFRSMHVDGGDDLHVRYLQELMSGEDVRNEDGTYKVKHDPRVTPLGRLLRKWSLDELPQFFNVLRGDMSLVGPRPDPWYARSGYSRWYHRRVLDVKPGITGLWQVKGRSRVTYENMVRMDLQYSHSFSPLNDLKLLAQTFRAVVSSDGAY